MYSTTHTKRSNYLKAIVYDTYGTKHPIVIDRLDARELRMRSNGYRPAIGDRVDLEFCRYTEQGLSVNNMRVIVVGTDPSGIVASIISRSETRCTGTPAHDRTPSGPRRYAGLTGRRRRSCRACRKPGFEPGAHAQSTVDAEQP
jgi:hypothetical protein